MPRLAKPGSWKDRGGWPDEGAAPVIIRIDNRVLIKGSLTYQLLFESARLEGAIAEARKILRLLGDSAFGPPDYQTAALLERLNDLPQLEELILQIWSATSWQELLEYLAPVRRHRKRQLPKKMNASTKTACGVASRTGGTPRRKKNT